MDTTRTRLRAQALGLFARRGFDAVTTAEIAEAAGVTQRTFFRHFPTKVEALFADADERTDAFANALFRQPLDRPTADALLAAIIETSPDAATTADDLVVAQILRDTPSLAGELRRYETRLETHFANWLAQRSGANPRDLTVRALAAMAVAARRVVVDEWREAAARKEPADLAAVLLPLIDAAVRAGLGDREPSAGAAGEAATGTDRR